MSTTKVVILKAQPEALKSIKETPKKPRKRPTKRQATTELEDTPKVVGKAAPAVGGSVVRALDRSGVPCRKWTKSTLQIRSFTGVPFDVVSWKGETDPNVPEVKQEPALPENNVPSSELRSELVSEAPSEPASEPPEALPV
ncbi:INO80 complex subunit 4 [Wickerhamiella sorbophila]|uniref:INO80 complex subunit 4 n=1 Tax=Wickerhamiella sorbophila TaxID=45607 RepID=A0A2T0FJ92_9ASCO|nr:INO80 complex subunit 4 [Wickerhamiella sorbophila]PRT55073.1 INO80 complex subunit 4 [Wickerhamiella sorbophila]